MKNTILSTAAVAGLLVAGPSWGVLVNEGCLGGSADDLSPSTECTYVYDNANPTGAANDSESALNGLNLFGYNTWEIFGKQEESNGSFSPDGTDAYSLVATNTSDNGSNSGLWSFDSSAWATFSSIVLVMKDGNNAPVPPQSAGNGFYAYLLSPTDSSGSWTTENSFGGADLSHLSAYGVRGEAQVPAPGVLGLMGIGLLGLFFASRRRV